MPGNGKAVFGKPFYLSGKSVGSLATAVPLGMVEAMRVRPIATTYTTGTFVVNGTAANPQYIWVGNDLAIFDETKTYTWTLAANTILSSAGVVTTAQAPVLGGWYFYVGISTAGAILLYPSQTAPNENSLNHPGTSKTIEWRYVGYQICDDATTDPPTSVAMTKIGYRMNFAELAIEATTAYAQLAFTGAKALPKHGSLGVTVGGSITCGAAATITVGSTSGATLGITKATNDSTADSHFPLPPMSPDADGKLWAIYTTAASDVNVTWISDIV